jgi:hypothetical protein
MGSFKNIENTATQDASYSAYKKLTSQDVNITSYIASKQFTVPSDEFTSSGVYSFLFTNYIEEE